MSTSSPMNEPESLHDLLDAAWTHMAKGAADRQHGFHLPVVSTLRDGAPTGRVVVVRVADRESRELLFHTDVRGGKTEELDSGISFTFYDPDQRLQVRAYGPACLADRQRTDARWAVTNNPARKCYMVQPAPGTVLEMWQSGQEGDLATGRVPTTEETAVARPNFGVVVAEVVHLEVMRVERLGHRRARFQWVDDGWVGTWIQA